MAVHPSAAVPIMRPHLPPLDQFAQLVAELFETRMLSNFGKYTGLLEERASGLLDHPSPLCVSSCDIGLTLAWQALECPPGEVIVPSFTFCSTVNALRWNGLEPVFADVDPQTYCIDVEDVRRLITPRTVGIAAVHVFGLPAAIEPLEGLAREHGLKLIFDAAHGLGGRYRGTALGAFGDASAFSLSGTKLVTGGEGGLVTFRDPADAERFTFLRAYGFKDDYNCRYVGLNGKLSELNAALGWLSLDLLEDALARRHAQVERYRRQAGRLPWPELAARAARVRARLQGSRRQVPKAGAACGRRGRPRGRRGHDETLLLPRPSHGGLPRVHEPLLARDRPPPRTPLMHPPLLRPIRRFASMASPGSSAEASASGRRTITRPEARRRAR